MKKALIIMTLVAVVSDYLLHPFYPQFFEARFGITDPKQVGYYFGALCFMVMVAFPFWAYISKKRAELNILIYTQFVAGVLALFCFFTKSYLNFWIVSMVMILFKGSYLLVYPYLLKIITKEEHPAAIGLLSVVVHLGGIMGAVIGGLTVDLIDASYIFLFMAIGDFVQMGMSVYLLKSTRYNTDYVQSEETKEDPGSILISKTFILKIGLVTMVLYFSDFLIRPFFSTYWESISTFDSKLISGSIYAIPGFVALLVLWINIKYVKNTPYHNMVVILVIGATGIFLQGIANQAFVIIGRLIYGWAIFKAVVQFDVLLFELSNPASYALDYSKVHFFQNLGVLISSFLIGFVVEQFGIQIPFKLAFGGFLLSLGMYYLLFKLNISATKKIIKPETT